jgi:hypothetical protein
VAAQPIETGDSYGVASHNKIFINTGLEPGAIKREQRKPFQRFFQKESR